MEAKRETMDKENELRNINNNVGTELAGVAEAQIHLAVKLQTLRCRCNCGKNTLTIHSRFDV